MSVDIMALYRCTKLIKDTIIGNNNYCGDDDMADYFTTCMHMYMR